MFLSAGLPEHQPWKKSLTHSKSFRSRINISLLLQQEQDQTVPHAPPVSKWYRQSSPSKPTDLHSLLRRSESVQALAHPSAISAAPCNADSPPTAQGICSLYKWSTISSVTGASATPQNMPKHGIKSHWRLSGWVTTVRETLPILCNFQSNIIAIFSILLPRSNTVLNLQLWRLF